MCVCLQSLRLGDELRGLGCGGGRAWERGICANRVYPHIGSGSHAMCHSPCTSLHLMHPVILSLPWALQHPSTALIAQLLPPPLPSHPSRTHTRWRHAGFKLDMLGKLSNIKGADPDKTSFLAAVVRQLRTQQPSILSLPDQLACVRAAANMEVCMQ